MAKQRNSPTASDPSADDTQAFRAAVHDVKPLVHTPRATGTPKGRPRSRLRQAAVENLDQSMPLVDPMPATADGADTPSGSSALSFQRSGVRTQVVRRLRRGLIPIEDELDLHGLTQNVARNQLADFLEVNRAAGRRCVRIIHGKGYRSGVRGPVLKIAVDLWLRRHLDVMAFTSARAIDGGTGAVYVLLRA